MQLDNILQTIGDTPLVKLHRIGRELNCNLYAKCEFLNPGGSIKDRIALRMIEQAEQSGQILPGDTLIEPTSGNTGIGMALAGAVKGYNIIITMPEKMSREKQVILEALGAQIIRTPTEAAWDSPESHIGIAKKLQKELPNAHILDQYSNPHNPLAHESGTGQEILDDLEGKVDMVVMGAGTGGTITGCAKIIKKTNPDCIIVGADPVGSILAGDSEVCSYKVEGIGYDFIPNVLERNQVDTWVKTTDHQSFILARRLIQEEGLLCGGSSGAALYAALKEAKKLPKEANCVVILPDGVRNYMSKFVDEKWMKDNRFTSLATLQGTVGNFASMIRVGPLVTLEYNEKAKKAIKLMREKGFSQIPVVDGGVLVGLLDESDLLEYLIASNKITLETPVHSIIKRNISTVNEDTPLSALQDLLLNSESIVVVDKAKKPINILTKIDLVEWIANQ